MNTKVEDLFDYGKQLESLIEIDNSDKNWKNCAQILINVNNEKFVIVCTLCSTYHSANKLNYEDLINHIKQYHEDILKNTSYDPLSSVKQENDTLYCDVDVIVEDISNDQQDVKLTKEDISTEFQEYFSDHDDDDDYKDDQPKSKHPLQCPTCRRFLKNKEQLQIHELAHSKNNKSIICKTCGKNFTKIEYLRKHLFTHMDFEIHPYKCIECRKTFISKLKRDEHIRRHTGEKPLKCRFCNEHFSNIRYRSKHEKTNHKNKDENDINKSKLKEVSLIAGESHKCEICTKEFINSERLRRHKISHLSFEEHPNKCDECKRVFTSKTRLKEHMRFHTGEKSVQCRFCSLCFFTNRQRYTHEKATHLIETMLVITNPNQTVTDRPKEAKSFISNLENLKQEDVPEEICSAGAKLHDTDALKSDETISKDLDENLHNCLDCKDIFTSEENLIMHICKHIDEKQLECRFCFEKFSSTKLRHKHEKIHNSLKSSESFQCKDCNKICSNKAMLNRHSLSHLDFDQHPYKCIDCRRTFPCQVNLNIHLLSHQREKTISCRFCEKKFNSEVLKRKHEVIHKEKEYLCNYCGKGFNVNYKLKMHIDRYHLKLKPFKCDFCEKSFASHERVKEHKRIHTREKPFGCDICKTYFATRETLRKHKYLHSDTNKYTCKICGKSFKQNAGLYMHKKTHSIA